jgi:hypothetical protein
MTANELLQALAAPFGEDELRWKPQQVSGTRCLAVPYLDARAVMDRLDAVFGLSWSDAYDTLPNGSVVCRLEVPIDGKPVVKCDVGSPSDQPDEGDRLKAAFSDALKRAAVKFGLGRYIYRLPRFWTDYDPQRREIKAVPQLPAWAIPGKPPAAGKGATVTHEQAKELQRLLQAQRNIDPAKFLRRYEVKRLSQLPLGRWQDALAMLKSPPGDILRGAA